MSSKLLLFVMGCGLLTACEIDKVGIPRSNARVALHGMLSATAQSQMLLLERTRSGTAPSYDLSDPVMNTSLAVSLAQVELTTPSGQTFFAVEDRGQGAGIYRIALAGDALERGGAYLLSVRTVEGEVLTAQTSVPLGTADTIGEQRVFDRSRDTVTITWPVVAGGARSYMVRIETPFGPRVFFTDSSSIRLTGGLRNVDVTSLTRVFIPGFPQAVTVSAVDSNFYDWFRTENNPLSGTGLVNRVEGGIGVFGSLVRLHFEEFSVVTPQSEPASGTFLFEGTLLERRGTPNLSIELYVESRAARADQADALSGRYERRPFLGMEGCATCGLLGNVRNGRIELAMLRAWSARDTADVFTGEIRGDTIVGFYRFGGGPVRFVKQ